MESLIIGGRKIQGKLLKKAFPSIGNQNLKRRAMSYLVFPGEIILKIAHRRAHPGGSSSGGVGSGGHHKIYRLVI